MLKVIFKNLGTSRPTWPASVQQLHSLRSARYEEAAIYWPGSLLTTIQSSNRLFSRKPQSEPVHCAVHQSKIGHLAAANADALNKDRDGNNAVITSPSMNAQIWQTINKHPKAGNQVKEENDEAALCAWTGFSPPSGYHTSYTASR